MTYYDEAELVYLFSGAAGKPGNGVSRAYSFKPDNKDVIINRGSNLAATRIGKDGFLEKGREQKLRNTVWAGAGQDTEPTGYTKSLHGNGTFNTTSTSGQIRFTTTDGTSDRSYIQGPAFTTSGPIVISVYVDEVYTACRVGSVIGFGGVSSNEIGVFEDDVKINLTTNVQAGKRYSFVVNRTDSDNGYARFGVGVDNFRQGDITLSRPQFESGTAATAYIENTSTSSTAKAGVLVDEPRFDYSKGEPRLMFEAKKQNLMPYSEYRTDSQAYNTSWSFGYSSPEGLPNAYRLTAINGDTSHFAVTPVISGLVNGRSYCASVFVKPIPGNSCTHVRFGITDQPSTTNVVYSYFDLTGDGAVGSSDEGSNSGEFEFAGIEKLPSGWFRIHVVGNIDGDDSEGNPITAFKTVLFLATDGSNPVAFNDNTAAVDVYGVSLEQFVASDGTLNGTKAVTSYIPTFGVAVTRDSDIPNTQNLPSSDQDKYSFFADVTQGEEAASNKAPRLQNSSGSSSANCGYYTSGSGNKSFFFDSNLGSGSNRNISLTKSTSTDNIKYLFVVDNDNLRTKLYVDGSLFADTNMPSASDVRAMTARADFDQIRLTASDNGETDFLKTVMTFPTELSHVDGEILTGATSFKLYEDMATANNYTVHV